MKVLVSGGAKVGKSGFAQALTLQLANGGRRYYVATMIPVDGEDLERIRLHLLDREGMGFETVECGKFLMECLDKADPAGAFLVDSATALLQNAMFPAEKGYRLDLEGARKCADDLVAFGKMARDVVYVSDYIYADAERYDPETEAYRKCLADIDRRLAQICDTVVEVTAGEKIIHKGVLAE